MEQQKNGRWRDSPCVRFFEPELQNAKTGLQKLLFARNELEAQLYPALEQAVRFRAYQPADHDACVEIYRRNEAGRFPEGSIKEFKSYLQTENKSLIVAEVDARPVGYGGISLQGPDCTCLCYGIVHPDFQGKRIGTTLTILRIAQIATQPKGNYFVIYAVDASAPFYSRLGFHFTMQWKAEDQKIYPAGILAVPAASHKKIKSTLEQRGVRIHGEFAPPSQGGLSCKVARHPGGFYYLEYTGKKGVSPATPVKPI